MQTYMIIERFKGGRAEPVYQRFAARGRLAPTGLEYLGSWVSHDLAVCFQLMQTGNKMLLKEWMACWDDLVEFEVVPVISTVEAAARLAASPPSVHEAKGSTS